MHFNLKRVSAIVLSTALVYSGSALAAYGPAAAPVVHKPGNWTLSAGYGQTFGHKKAEVTQLTPISVTTNNVTLPQGKIRLDDLKIFEVDLFHSSGFGVVYMGTAEDGKLLIDVLGVGTQPLGDNYTFNGIFGAYKMALGRDMSVRLGVGQTDQKAVLNTVTIKLDGGIAWNVEGKWNMSLGNNLNAFVAGGWLNQKEKTVSVPGYTPVDYDTSAGYWKVGVSFTM